MTNRSQTVLTGVVAIGAGLLVVAGGLIYSDYRKREGAWADLQFRQHEPDARERADILRAWSEDTTTLPTIFTGAPGAALVVFGALGLFQRRRMLQKEARG